jgi:hypothetical protein
LLGWVRRLGWVSLLGWGRVLTDENGDHGDEQPGGGQRAERRLLAALPGLVGGERLGYPGIGLAAVAAELPPARTKMPATMGVP